MGNKQNPGGVHAETLCSIAILFALVTIAGVFLLVQGGFDRDFFFATESQKSFPAPATIKRGGESPAEILHDIQSPGFKPSGPAETFNAETLSNKIDGRADLYLECGFVRLDTLRFAKENDPVVWFEVFLYEMGAPENAFAVYSIQRRKDGRDATLAPFAYTVENAIFFMHGKYYTEMVASEASDVLNEALLSSSQNLLQRHPPEAFSLPEMSLLPEDARLKESEKLFLKNAFGFEKFSRVLTAIYRQNEKEMMAFVTTRKGTGGARALAEEYRRFLVSLGGEERKVEETAVPGLIMIDMAGDIEVFFCAGDILAGIHAARDKEAALALVRKLYTHITTEAQSASGGHKMQKN